MALVLRGAIVLTQPSFKLGMFVLVVSGMLDSDDGAVAASGSQKPGQLKLELHQDNASEYRWRLPASDGQVISSSTQGYKAGEGSEHAVGLIKKMLPTGMYKK